MYKYIPNGVCAKEITFDITNNNVHNVHFEGGCNGNGKGVASLAEGLSVDTLIERLSSIECKTKGTSCPAQLAQALIEIKNAHGKIK